MSTHTARRGRVLANLGLLGFSLLLTGATLDVALRFIYPPPIRWTFPQEYYDFDPEIAHALRPSQESFTHDKPVSVNSLGLRDREYSPTPEPGLRRVLGIGDSQTFGNGVDLAETWPKQLERNLNEMASDGGGEGWEVLNAGIPGTDTWQHEIWARRLLDAYQPHAVVLAFYVNDVSPSYQPKGNRAKAKTNTFEKRVVYLLKRSALINIVVQRWAAWKHSQRMKEGRAVSEFIVTGERNERIDRGWQQVDESLAAIAALCEERKIAFLLAVLPRRDQVTGVLSSRVYNDRLTEITSRHGVARVDVLPDLIEAYGEHGADLFIPWDGHNSPVANRVIGTRIGERLRRMGSLVAAR